MIRGTDEELAELADRFVGSSDDIEVVPGEGTDEKEEEGD